MRCKVAQLGLSNCQTAADEDSTKPSQPASKEIGKRVHLVLMEEVQALDDVQSNRGAFVIPVELSWCSSQRLSEIAALCHHQHLQRLTSSNLSSSIAC